MMLSNPKQKNQSGVTNYPPPPQARGRGRGANEVISVRPNKGTAEQRDGRTKGRSTGAGANYPQQQHTLNELIDPASMTLTLHLITTCLIRSSRHLISIIMTSLTPH